MPHSQLPEWFAKLKRDEDLDAYKCKYKLAGRTVDIFLFVDDQKLASRRSLALAAQELLQEWPNQIRKIVTEVRKQLRKEKRLARKDESVVSAESLYPFSLSLFQNDGEDYYSFGLKLTQLLDDDEYIDYSRDVAHTWTTVEIASTESDDD